MTDDDDDDDDDDNDDNDDNDNDDDDDEGDDHKRGKHVQNLLMAQKFPNKFVLVFGEVLAVGANILLEVRRLHVDEAHEAAHSVELIAELILHASRHIWFKTG